MVFLTHSNVDYNLGIDFLDFLACHSRSRPSCLLGSHEPVPWGKNTQYTNNTIASNTNTTQREGDREREKGRRERASRWFCLSRAQDSRVDLNTQKRTPPAGKKRPLSVSEHSGHPDVVI